MKGNFVLVILFLLGVYGAKDLPLPPLFAYNIGDISSQPSGVTYCSSTDRIYVNCDKCDYLAEFDININHVQDLLVGDFRDIEAVACYDEGGYLLIGQEGIRHVEVFLLDDYIDRGNGNQELQDVYGFDVVTGTATSSRSGLEGMTVNESNGDVFCSNEKGPAMIVRLHSDGVQFDSQIIDFVRDISGLAYDTELDLLWILSDQDEKVYLTDLTGTILHDSWDLPVRNPEGIAINNNSNPKMLYIVTDPSAPSGPQYLPLIVGFEKPIDGSGYANFDGTNYPDYVTNPPPCDGCDEAFIEEEQDSSNRSPSSTSGDDSSEATNITISLIVLMGIIFLIL